MKNEPKKKRTRSAWIVDESKCFKKHEVTKLRAYCFGLKNSGLKKHKFSPVRNWFMVELGLNAGLRVDEMASLKHKNFFIEEGCSSISLIGKGRKKRTVWISSKFRRICHEYIKIKKEFNYETSEEDFVLNNLKGEKISKRALQKFFKQIIERSGLPRRYYIHCLRHTYSTFLLKASGNNYRFVQEQLGHASIKTTQVYAGIIESEGRRSIEKLYV